MKNNDINPELKKKLESLQEVPKRDLQDILRGREIFLAQASELEPPQTSPKKTKTRSASPSRRNLVPRLVGILAVLILAMSSIGGTIYGAQASGPNDLLYPVKILTEDIQVGLESDPQDRLDLHTSFANRRLQEIQAQVLAGEEVSPKALALLEKHTQRMLQEAGQMSGKGLENALLQIQSNLQKQNQMMEKIKDHPHGGPPGLLRAQERIQSRLELVDNGIKEPKGFKEKIEKEKPDKGNQDSQKDKEKPNKPETPPGLEGKDPNGNGNDN